MADKKAAKKNKNKSGLKANNPSSIVFSVMNLLVPKIESLVKEAFNSFSSE